MKTGKVVIDSDIIVDHLLSRAGGNSGPASVLRQLMASRFCYTTVFNVIELFGICRTKKQTDAMENVLGAMKVLGLNGKSGKRLGALRRKDSRGRNRDLQMLIAGVCMESRLPLVTERKKCYRSIKGLSFLVPGRGI